MAIQPRGVETMRYDVNSVDEYIKKLPDDRAKVITKLIEIADASLDEDFQKTISYDMIGYVVPKEIYPDGYLPKPGEPLPFLSFASQKNHVAIYHMGMYMDTNLLNWFIEEYPKHVSTKLDMGKSCIRFKNMTKIPYSLLEELFSKMSLKDYVILYEKQINK